jgi:hypothetical protein
VSLHNELPEGVFSLGKESSCVQSPKMRELDAYMGDDYNKINGTSDIWGEASGALIALILDSRSDHRSDGGGHTNYRG